MSASWASSSARSTLRVIRARPAMSLARSIRKTASIARWVSFAAIPALSEKPSGKARRGAGSAALHFLAELLVVLDDLGRHRVAEILDLVERTDLDLARPHHRVGAALHPLGRLVHVLDFPQPIAGDQLARLGERAIDHGPAGTVECDPLAFPRGLEAVAGQHDASVDQLLVELADCLVHG